MTGYYWKKEKGLWVLRQKRFKKNLQLGKPHPHDIMAYARTETEKRRMRKLLK